MGRTKQNKDQAKKNRLLFEEYQRAKDSGVASETLRVRNEIILENWRIAEYLVSRWYNKRRQFVLHLDIEDLKQAAFFAMCRAIDNFDPQRGFTFATYLFHWIRHSTQRSLVADNLVRRPINKHETNKLVHLDSHEPYVAEIITSSGDKEEDTAELLYQDAERAAIGAHVFDNLRDWLSDRDATIIERYMHGDTLQEIGEDFGLSRERVRQRKRDSLALLREAIGEDGERVKVA